MCFGFLEESGTYDTECCRKMTCGGKGAGVIGYLVNGWSLSLGYYIVAYRDKLLREKERSRTRIAQRNHLRGLLIIRRMDRIPYTRIRELFEVTKEVNERIDEGAFRWFSYFERMGTDRIAKRGK